MLSTKWVGDKVTPLHILVLGGSQLNFIQQVNIEFPMQRFLLDSSLKRALVPNFMGAALESENVEFLEVHVFAIATPQDVGQAGAQ